MPQWQRNVYAIWVAQFLAMVGLTLIVPFLPFYLRTLGVATTEDVERWSGFLFAAHFLVQTLATPLWGVLGARYARKMMVLRAMLGIGLTNMLSPAVRSPGQLVALRAVQGGRGGGEAFPAAGPRRGEPGGPPNLAYFVRSPARRTTGLLLGTSQIAVMSVEPIFAVYVRTLGVASERAATVAGVLFSVTGLTWM